ncbi:patatin-like phospholipase family protein [Dyella amyloliquefaciens]|uniref:patatin-like phospholipase family protein n=1 Tax=Dyella amyloliquefaciens TaxID=1770545 RepID=UPI00102E6503|nr:patatin-like phospholipase family protein [Dyella amyloliquefaciens]
MPLPDRPIAVDTTQLGRFHRVVFAGGGNRCWWQAGLMHCLMDRGMALPPMMVGTSAGAAIAASCLTGGTPAALASCKTFFSATTSVWDHRHVWRGRLDFAHERIYPAWIGSFVHEGNFGHLASSTTRLMVAFTRPSRALGLAGSLFAGTLAHVLDKHLWHRIHPELPRRFGLRQDYAVLNTCADPAEAQNILVAAAAAPPLIRTRTVDALPALDGGYVDSAPVPETPESNSRDHATLILLTRHYPALPQIFDCMGRRYWQPSRPVPVSTWDCTRAATVSDAFSLGFDDACEAMKKGRMVL